MLSNENGRRYNNVGNRQFENVVEFEHLRKRKAKNNDIHLA